MGPAWTDRRTLPRLTRVENRSGERRPYAHESEPIGRSADIRRVGVSWWAGGDARDAAIFAAIPVGGIRASRLRGRDHLRRSLPGVRHLLGREVVRADVGPRAVA